MSRSNPGSHAHRMRGLLGQGCWQLLIESQVVRGLVSGIPVEDSDDGSQEGCNHQ